MIIYECPECGNVKDGRDYQTCSNPCNDVGMYEIILWGKNGVSEVANRVMALNKAKKIEGKPLNSAEMS